MPADGYLNFDTKIDTDGFKKGVKDVDKNAKNFGSSIEELGNKIKTAFNVAAVVAFGKTVIDAAADVKAAGSQFEQTFGEMQTAANEAISRVAAPADILEERLRGSATQIYAFAKTSGMESAQALSLMEDALRVAADSAAYYDRSIEDTTATLQSFLKGNYENDAALGLSATEVTRNAMAMELYGDSFKNLSEAQKQITLLKMVEEANSLSGAMGQAAREADGWANVTGNLSEVWHQFLGAIGQPLLALAVPVVQGLTDAMTGLMTIISPERIEAFTARVVELAESAAGVLLPALQGIGTALQSGFALAAQYIDTEMRPRLAEIENAKLPVESFIPDNIAERLDPIRTSLTEEFPRIAESVGETFRQTLKTVGEWFTTTLPGFVSSGIELAAVTISGLLDTFTTVFDDIWAGVVEPFFSTFVENILPTFTDLGTELNKTLTVAFDEVKPAFDSVWTDVIKPVLDDIGAGWNDLWALVQDKWDKWGAPIFEKLRTAFEKSGDTFDNIWNTKLEPVWDNIMKKADETWNDHLKPFCDNFLDLIGTIVDGALTIYNDFILPVVDWLTNTFGPSWAKTKNTIVEIVDATLGKLIDWASSVVSKFKEMVNFITAIFTGDWKRAMEAAELYSKHAWDGITNLFKGAVNGIIGFLNGLVDGVIDGFNDVIRALNRIHVDIPDWVPVFGGKSFGINLRTLSATRIPYLASGAVIPPNREFLAVLGDQTRGTNIEAPLDTIVEAMRIALRNGGGRRGQQTVILQLDKREFGRAVIETGDEETHRIGLRLVTK